MAESSIRKMAQYLILPDFEIRKITQAYGIELVDYEPIEEGAGNTNYLINTRQNRYILTLFEIETQRVFQLCKLLNLLEEFQYPTTRVMKMLNGESITSYQGKSIILKPYIEGEVIKQLELDKIRQIGKNMARLHEIPEPDFMPVGHAYGFETFSRIVGKNINRDYEYWLEQKYEYLKASIPENLPTGLIHGDLFYDNVIFEGKECKAIIDFEEACCYYKIFDLGMAGIGLCVDDSSLALDKTRALIEGYQKRRVLEDQEKVVLQLFVEYAAIATSSWRFWKFNIDTPILEKSDKHEQMVLLANSVSDIPKEKFGKVVFG